MNFVKKKEIYELWFVLVISQINKMISVSVRIDDQLKPDQRVRNKSN